LGDGELGDFDLVVLRLNCGDGWDLFDNFLILA